VTATQSGPGVPKPPRAGALLGRGGSAARAPGAVAAVAPSAGRVAGRGRQWQRNRLLLGLLVMLLGGAVTMWAVTANTHTERVLVVARDVRVGSQLTVDDLQGADLSAGSAVSSVPVSRADSVLGRVALVNLSRGSLLSAAQVGSGSALAAGQLLVPLSLKPGQLPALGLAPGQLVLVVPTPSADASGRPSAVAEPVQATVVDTGAVDPSTGATVVDVRVAQAAAVALARAAASGNVTVVLLPGSGS